MSATTPNVPALALSAAGVGGGRASPLTSKRSVKLTGKSAVSVRHTAERPASVKTGSRRSARVAPLPEEATSNPAADAYADEDDSSTARERREAAKKKKPPVRPGRITKLIAKHPLQAMLGDGSDGDDEADESDRRSTDSPRGEFADSALHDAEQTGEYNLAVKDTLSEGLFSLEHLFAVRLINQGYSSVPSRVPMELTQLTILSLRSNKIRECPRSIGLMTALTDLSMMKNKITLLPTQIGLLTRLTNLDVSSNRLETVPDSIGLLTNLTTLNLQDNRLSGLPGPARGLASLTYLDLSLNKMRALSSCICYMPALTTLILSRNQLQSLPESIGKCTTLQTLHISNNEIKEMPLAIGDLVNLREFWLEWNQFEALPKGISDLRSLKQFKADGNPLSIPPITIVLQGVDKLKEWCKTNTQASKQRQRQRIVWAVQQVLAEALEHNLADPGHLIANVDHDWSAEVDDSAVVEVSSTDSDSSDGDLLGEKKGGFVASTAMRLAKAKKAAQKMVKKKLADFQQQDLRCYGVSREAWSTHILPAVMAHRRSKGDLNQWEFSFEEIEDALEGFRDKYSRSGIARIPVLMRRCACVDEHGRRRVCIPPTIGYMCRVDGMLVRMHIKTSNEVKSDKSRAEEDKAAVAARRNTKRETKEYLASVEGKQWVEEKALEQLNNHEEATDLAKARHKRLMKRFKEMSKWERKRNKIAVQRQRKKTKLREKKKKLMEKAEHVAEDVRVDLINKCRDIRDTIKHGLAESAKLDELHNTVMELKKEHQLDDEDIVEEEAAAFRKIPHAKNPLIGAIEAADSCPAYVAAIAAEVDACADFLQVVHEHTFTLPQWRRLIASRLLKKKVEDAVEQVHHDFALIRKVAASWQGASVRQIFQAWRQWVAGRLVERLQKKRMDKSQREHEEAAAKVAEELRRLELLKWEERVDPYTDEIYWEHNETGETVKERPVEDPFLGRGEGSGLTSGVASQYGEKDEANRGDDFHETPARGGAGGDDHMAAEGFGSSATYDSYAASDHAHAEPLAIEDV